MAKWWLEAPQKISWVSKSWTGLQMSLPTLNNKAGAARTNTLRKLIINVNGNILI